MKKVRGSILSPFLSPRILDQPAVLSIDDIPSDDLNCVFGRESLIFRVDLIKSTAINKEVSIDWDCDDDWTVICDFLLDVF